MGTVANLRPRCSKGLGPVIIKRELMSSRVYEPGPFVVIGLAPGFGMAQEPPKVLVPSLRSLAMDPLANLVVWDYHVGAAMGVTLGGFRAHIPLGGP